MSRLRGRAGGESDASGGQFCHPSPTPGASASGVHTDPGGIARASPAASRIRPAARDWLNADPRPWRTMSDRSRIGSGAYWRASARASDTLIGAGRAHHGADAGNGLAGGGGIGVVGRSRHVRVLSGEDAACRLRRTRGIVGVASGVGGPGDRGCGGWARRSDLKVSAPG